MERITRTRSGAPHRIIRRRRAEDTGRTERLTEILQSISNIDAEITARQSERLQLVTEAEMLYNDLKLNTPYEVPTEHGLYSAAITRSAGRASSIINPEKFAELVEPEDFYMSIKVLKEKAEALLSGKELAGITTTVAAVPGEPTFTIMSDTKKRGR